MSSSSNTKTSLIKRLETVYGAHYKSPLARALEVNVSTIRRLFNSSKPLPLVYQKAIEKHLSERLPAPHEEENAKITS